MSRDLFRNVEGSQFDPVYTWPYEGMVAVIEQGTLPDWRPLIAHLFEQPWGVVARYLEHYLTVAPEQEVADFFSLMLADSREQAERSERDEVVRRVQHLWRQSGQSKATFARAIGTSASRLSTYLNGQVVPSASMMVRMERVSAAQRHQGILIPTSVGDIRRVKENSQ